MREILNSCDLYRLDPDQIFIDGGFEFGRIVFLGGLNQDPVNLNA